MSQIETVFFVSLLLLTRLSFTPCARHPKAQSPTMVAFYIRIQMYARQVHIKHTRTHIHTHRVSKKTNLFLCFLKIVGTYLCSTLKWCNTVFIIYDWLAHHGDGRPNRLYIKTFCPCRESDRESVREKRESIGEKRNTLYCVVIVCLSVSLSASLC